MSFPVTWTEVENRLELSGGTLTGSLNTKNVSITGNLSVSGSITGNASSATKLATSRTISLTGDATASGSFNGTANLALATTLADSGVKAGSYGPTAAATLAFGGSVNIPQITVDAKGRATSIVNRATKLPAAPTTITGNAGTATKLATARTISLTGDATGSTTFDGSANKSIAVTLADSGVTAGSYGPTAATTLAFGGSVNVPQITVDDKGRSTAIVNRAIKLPATPTTVSGNAGSATKLATARTIDGVSFNGTANIIHYGTCSTAAATVAKTVSCTGFTLVTGAEITIRFTVTNTAASPTLNVNNTGAKAIVYRNAAISAGYLAANRVYKFVYDGTNYELIGDINTNTNNKTTMTVTTSGTYPILGTYTANRTATATEGTRFASAIKIDPANSAIIADKITSDLVTTTYLKGNQGHAIVNSTAAAGSYVTIAKYNSDNGVFTLSGFNETMLLAYTDKATINADKNTTIKSATLLNEDGNAIFPGTVTASTFSGKLSGNANTSTKLATARSIRINLASTSAVNFDGSANITPGVTGVLPVANGGTGNTTGTAAVASKLGTTTVGSTSKPIYLNAGNPTVLSATVGAANKPIYSNAGTLTACSSTVGSATQPTYMKAGTITACTSYASATVGNSTKWNGAAKTVSTAAPSGGANGDIWFQY